MKREAPRQWLTLVLVILVTVGATLISAGAITGCCQKTGDGSGQTGAAAGGRQEPSASQSADVERILRWNLGSDPKTIDPQLNSASDGADIINNLYEGLMRESEGSLQPAMAERHTVSEDLLTYTFYLREAKWSDGQPVTAHDFAYAWKRALNPKTASEYAFQLFYIKGGQDYFEGRGTRDDVAVKALDDKTLQVTLVAPTPYFINLSSFFTYQPVRRSAVEKGPDGSWAKDPGLAVTNGPFKLAEYVTGSHITLVKNEHYWQAGKVKLDRIQVYMIVDASTGLTAFESGDIDVLDNVPSQEIPRLLAEDPTFSILPMLGTYYYIFNVTKPPVDDVRVRRALTLAIDRTAIVETVTKGGQIPADSFVPPGLKDAGGREFNTVSGSYGIDTSRAQAEEARNLLSEAGYPGGEGFPEIELLYNTSEGHKAVAEAVQEMWKDHLGIRVRLANQEWAVFQDTRHQGTFTVARGGWIGDYADPMTFLDMWLSYSGHNDAQWNNPGYDAIIEKSKVTTGKERYDLLYEAEKIFIGDEMVVAPIYFYTDQVMVKEHVQGWEKDSLNHFYFGLTSLTE